MKKILSILLTLVIILLAFPKITVSAAYKSGTVGNVEYTISGSHLIISGNGGMGYTSRWPWGRDITELTILEGVTSISRTAFAECKFLSFVELPNSLKIIENNAFYGCENLEFIDIPSGVSKIGGSAFGDCYNLRKIVLPRDLTEFDSSMLNGCTSLERIDVDDGNKKLCSTDGVLFSADKTTLIKYPMGRYDEYYSIPSGVKTIFENAFGGASYLEDIDIPSSVTKIGQDAFTGTRFLELFTSYQNGVLTVGHCAITAEGDFGSIFTDGYSVIADGAFEYCSGLTGMHIKSEITRIGENTFKNCKNLKQVALSPSVKEIANNAFSGCDALKEVYFAGTPTEAQKIKIGLGNSCFTSAKWYYNTCGYNSDHQWLFYSREEPTCTRKGKLTEQCLFCDKLRSESIPVANHSWTLKIIKKATCNSAGAKQKTCQVCHKTETEIIRPLGHEFEDNITIKGQISCKKAADIKCRRCGTPAIENKALISHKYGEWSEIKAPTCTLEGTKTRVCSDCKQKQTRIISALGHSFEKDAIKKEATIYSKGRIEGKCTRCKADVKQDVPCTYQNKKLGIKIEADEGVFKKGTVISVVRVEDDSPLIPQIEGLPKKFAAYSISAKIGTKAVKPNGKFKVTIEVPEDFSQDVEVYKLGLVEIDEIKSSLSSGEESVTVELKEFGNYAICDLSQGVATKSIAKNAGNDAFDLDFKLILNICVIALAAICLQMIIAVAIIFIVSKASKKK